MWTLKFLNLDIYHFFPLSFLKISYALPIFNFDNYSSLMSQEFYLLRQIKLKKMFTKVLYQISSINVY